MDWLYSLFVGGGIAHTVFTLALVITAGILLGKVKVCGISLGITWILFVGIIAAHFGMGIPAEVRHFIQEFGLILFVFSIGMQVGPGFFASFKHGGLTLVCLASTIVLLGVGVAYVIHLVSGTPIPTMVGILSGAVTNTPGLGAAQQAYADASGVEDPSIALGYAVAYPLGVIGIIFSMIFIRYAGLQAACKVFQSVVQAGDIAEHIRPQRHRMGKSAFERDPILVAPAIISQHHGKAPVLPQKNSVGTCHTGANINDSLAGALFFGVVPAIHLHAAEALLGLGVGRRQRHILLIARDPFREPGDFLRVFPIHQFLQSVHLVQVAGFQHIEPRHLHIQVALLDNKWVAGGQCLDFRIAEGSFIYIIRHTDGGLAGHDLGDELLLVLHIPLFL